MLRLLFPISLSVLLAGCGSDDFTCSSQAVIDTIGNIARKEVAKGMEGIPLDLDRTSFKLNDMRQQGGNQHQLACAANLTPRFVLGTIPAGSSLTITQAQLDNGVNSVRLDITYTVEKLDKGGVYVTVRGL
ncbi:hypothetical protein [Bradyrhizobium diazoefficiens]|uniref:hypothetical protein n=1 Tax=Bradyrhizobium diazoefficiens TaxID=1355477 RepID=UPI00348598F5